jgi:hypothetical protein
MEGSDDIASLHGNLSAIHPARQANVSNQTVDTKTGSQYL